MKIVKAIILVSIISLFVHFHALAFSTHDTTIITKDFDKIETASDPIYVTVTFTHAEHNGLRGFYYSEHIPNNLVVNPVSLRIDGVDISDFSFETGSDNEIYQGYTPYRWILETPPDFLDNNAIDADSNLEIVYSIASLASGSFDSGLFNWTACLLDSENPDNPEAVFGYSEDADSITIMFTDGDTPPTIANPISDVSVTENSSDTIIDLQNVFTDVDNDDSDITKSVHNNSNESLVSASINGNALTLSYTPNQHGTATIVVRGTSNGLIVDDTFEVVVTANGDNTPTVANPISDVSVTENSPDTIIDLQSVFTDVDNDDSDITKFVYNNSNESLVSASINGNELTLSYTPNQHGTATIVIRGTSNGLIVDDTFEVVVTANGDNAPTVANPISDVSVTENSPDTIIDLQSVFTDVDNDDSDITKSVHNNSNQSLVSVSINGNALTLSYTPDQHGTATIVIRGTSNGLIVDDSFNVTVVATNPEGSQTDNENGSGSSGGCFVYSTFPIQ